MIIKSSRAMNVAAFQEPITPPVQKAAVPAPTVRKSEKPQPKKLEDKLSTVEIKPEVKAESQVEIKKEEEIIEVPKKRSLLEEVLEEQTNFED